MHVCMFFEKGIIDYGAKTRFRIEFVQLAGFVDDLVGSFVDVSSRFDAFDVDCNRDHLLFVSIGNVNFIRVAIADEL